MVTRGSLWKCRDGRSLRLWQIGDTHLVHCVHNIRVYGWRREWLPILESELNRRRRIASLRLLTFIGNAATIQVASNNLQTLVTYGA